MHKVVALILASISTACAITCRDQYNANVSWYAIYKMPTMTDSLLGASKGIGFYYLDVNDRKTFKPSAVTIDEPHQAIGYTLNQYYSQISDSSLLHVFYNDEPADDSVKAQQDEASQPRSVEYGHTKGVLLFDESSGSGIWLVHSVPKFPLVNRWEYPESGTDYGQTFLCLTVETATLGQLGTILYYNHPDVYSANMPEWATGIAPDLVKVLSGQYNKDAASTHYRATLTVKGDENGPKKEVFAKTYLFNDDLWAGLVAPAYGSMEVETWRRGDLIPTDCMSANPVFDAQEIQLEPSAEFSYTKDHSKYGRTMQAGITCIGDINRMTSQYARGGGTVCIDDDDLWNAFSVFKEVPTCTQSEDRNQMLRSNRIQ